MGQEITVTVRQGASPDVRIFDANRSLTGMSIEQYGAPEEASGSRPPDVLARRLFDVGARRVTVYSNDVIVDAPADRWPELEPKIVETIKQLFGFYGDDAGWSDESLRAMGIDPLPRPEPTA